MPRWRLGRVDNVTICQASSLKEKPSASGGGVSSWSQIALWPESPPPWPGPFTSSTSPMSLSLKSRTTTWSFPAGDTPSWIWLGSSALQTSPGPCPPPTLKKVWSRPFLFPAGAPLRTQRLTANGPDFEAKGVSAILTRPFEAPGLHCRTSSKTASGSKSPGEPSWKGKGQDEVLPPVRGKNARGTGRLESGPEGRRPGTRLASERPARGTFTQSPLSPSLSTRFIRESALGMQIRPGAQKTRPSVTHESPSAAPGPEGAPLAP